MKNDTIRYGGNHLDGPMDPFWKANTFLNFAKLASFIQLGLLDIAADHSSRLESKFSCEMRLIGT